METNFSSGFAARVAAHAGEAVMQALPRVSRDFLVATELMSIDAEAARHAERAPEEHIIVMLSAISTAVHGAPGPQYAALREALAEQMVQLWDAVVDRDTPVQVADETEFGVL